MYVKLWLSRKLKFNQLVGEFFECGGCNAHGTFGGLYLCLSVFGFSTIDFPVLLLTFLWAVIPLTYKINEVFL